MFAFCQITGAHYLNVFGLFQNSAPYTNLLALASGKPRTYKSWDHAWKPVSSGVRQFGLTGGQSVVAEMQMDGALVPLESIINEKF